MTPQEQSYTDGKTLWPYIPSDVPDDGISDFQNEFIGVNVDLIGSNVIHQAIKWVLFIDSVQMSN